MTINNNNKTKSLTYNVVSDVEITSGFGEDFSCLLLSPMHSGMEWRPAICIAAVHVTSNLQ